MKFSHFDETRLVASDRNWILGVILIPLALFFLWFGTMELWPEDKFAAVFSAVFGAGTCIGALLLGAHRTELLFDRSEDRAVLRIRTVSSRFHLPLALSDVSHVEVEYETGYRNKRVARPVLIVTGGMDAGRHPIIPSYGEVRPTERLARTLNAWLEKHGKA